MIYSKQHWHFFSSGSRYQRYSSEAGVSELIPLALVLPVALMLFAAVVDFTRVPLAQERLLSALQSAAYQVEASLAADESSLTADSFAPAGSVLCSLVSVSSDCDSTITEGLAGRQGFFSTAVSGEFVARACVLAGEQYSTVQSGFIGMAGQVDEFSFQFALLKAKYDPTDGAFDSIVSLAVSEPDCSPLAALFGSISNGIVTADSISTALSENFAQGDSNGGTRGAWIIENDSSNGNPTTNPQKYLPSIWLVGIGVAKVKHLVSDSFGGSNTISQYFIRPMNNPANIQSSRF